MTDHVEELVEALRLELQHYGELLALLDADGSANPLGLTSVVAALDAVRRQGAMLGDARRQRLQVQSRLAWAIERPQENSLPALLPDLPPDYQPLLRALSDEVEDLQARVRERARLNHHHLHAAADQLEGFIDTVATPASHPAGDGPATHSANA
jgi:hypothetical protein